MTHKCDPSHLTHLLVRKVTNQMMIDVCCVVLPSCLSSLQDLIGQTLCSYETNPSSQLWTLLEPPTPRPDSER